MNSPASRILRVEGLSCRLGGNQILQGLTLPALRGGGLAALLGPNGSGKSTLLKLIVGLYRPTSGSVTIDGEPPSVRTKAKVAYLPEIDYLYGWMNVAQTLRYVRAYYPDWDDEKARELLAFLELPEEAKVSKLSKGMRARLKILLAMARHAEVILLDEPLSGIDPPSRTRVMSALVSHFRAERQTVVMSTHDVVEAESLFDQVIFLRDGQVALYGDAEALREEKGKSIKDLFEEVYG